LFLNSISAASYYYVMPRTAINNVLVFDREELSGPKTVVIDGATIGNDEARLADIIIDGNGCTLLPGFFDCHVHIEDLKPLASCASFGVTTVCDMGCQVPEKYGALHSANGPTRWLGAGLPGFAENSIHARLFKFAGIGSTSAIHDTTEATKFVVDRVKENVDYIKIIADVPGHDQEVLDKIQEEAQKHGKMTIAHTAHYDAFPRGLNAGFNVLTHTPLDKTLDSTIIENMVSQKTIAVPTLTMMEMMASSWFFWLLRGTTDFQIAVDGVAAMNKGKVPILAGTDTNTLKIMGIQPGRSLHHELELLVRAGLTPTEALRSATSLPARYFKVSDRGRILPGLRADLVLVEGNPTEDITLTQKIKKVWSGGTEVQPSRMDDTGNRTCVMM
jgi:imidazolonepropionase-like amidohydrolase